MKFYELRQDIKHFSIFLEKPLEDGNYFSIEHPVFDVIKPTIYKPVAFELYRNDSGKFNFKMDIARFSSTIFIISDKTIHTFNGFFEKAGSILPIITKSKRKKFFGFIPNKSFLSDDIINLQLSDWGYGMQSRCFHKIILNQKTPFDDMLFSFKNTKTIIVNEDFKDIVEKNNLQGFDFSHEIPLIYEDTSIRQQIDQQKHREFEEYKKNYIQEYGEEVYYLRNTPPHLMSEEQKKKHQEYIEQNYHLINYKNVHK